MKQISENKLKELLKAQHKLYLLEDAGVDNWDGYSEALSPDNGVPFSYYCDNLLDEIVDKWPNLEDTAFTEN